MPTMAREIKRRAVISMLTGGAGWGLSGCSLMKPGPSQVLGRFLQSVERSELDTAVRFVSTRVRQIMGDPKLKAGLDQQGQQMRSRGGIVKITTQSEQVKGDVARVSSLIEFKNGSRTSDTTKLIKERSDWKIDGDK